jgi:phage FluMu protein Com
MITIISCNGEKKNNKVVASEENNTFQLKKNNSKTINVNENSSEYSITQDRKFIVKKEDIANNPKKSITKPDKTWIGEYIIKTDALSNADNKKFTLRYYITINSLSDAILSIGAENPQDYTCEGDYTLQIDNNTLFASGKCDEDDINDFYIKKENNSFFIKSKRFLSKDWLEIKKE